MLRMLFLKFGYWLMQRFRRRTALDIVRSPENDPCDFAMWLAIEYPACFVKVRALSLAGRPYDEDMRCALTHAVVEATALYWQRLDARSVTTQTRPST